MSDLDETFRKCSLVISWCIPIIEQNTSRVIKFKHNEIFYREILRFLSDFKQLRLTDQAGTFRECCRDTSGQFLCLCRHFKSCTIFKRKKIFYWVISRIFKELMQLPMTDWTEIFRDCYWYTSGLIAWLWRSFKAYTLLKHKEIFVKQKFQLKVQIGKNFYSSFSAMIWVGRIFVSSHKFRTGP